mgnify:CR=1 FL=1
MSEFETFKSTPHLSTGGGGGGFFAIPVFLPEPRKLPNVRSLNPAKIRQILFDCVFSVLIPVLAVFSVYKWCMGEKTRFWHLRAANARQKQIKKCFRSFELDLSKKATFAANKGGGAGRGKRQNDVGS